MLFDHLDLFRFSDFVLLLLFVLGVLCAFARGLVHPIFSSSPNLAPFAPWNTDSTEIIPVSS